MKEDKNKELQSRREFFKSAAKAALPVVGAMIVAQMPMIGQAATTGCDYGCTSSCLGHCYGACGSACSTSCTQSCTGGCWRGCSSANKYG